MKTKIEQLIAKLDINISESKSDDTWMKGRISAFKGVRKELKEILNEATVEQVVCCQTCIWDKDTSYISCNKCINYSDHKAI